MTAVFYSKDEVDHGYSLEFSMTARRQYVWKVEDLIIKINETRKVLASLTDGVVADLVRRSAETSEPDGYGSGSTDEGRSSDIFASSTAAAALKGFPSPDPDASGNPPRPDKKKINGVWVWEQRQRERDFIAEALDQLFSSVVEMSGHASLIEKKQIVVLRAGDKLAGRVTDLVQCKACHRDVACTTADPIRAGYCAQCDPAWRRWKDAHDMTDPGSQRLLFESQRPKYDDHESSACLLCVDPVYKGAKAS